MSRQLSYVQAFNEAIRQEMAADDNVFCAGEDIGAFGGVFQTYAGLQKEFGERRVVDTPSPSRRSSASVSVQLSLGCAQSSTSCSWISSASPSTRSSIRPPN